MYKEEDSTAKTPNKPKRLLRLGAILALGGAAFGLSGCAQTEALATSPTETVATATTSPSPEVTTQTVTPTPEVSATPEVSTKFEGAVNYDRFTKDWEAADRNGRLAICAEFFAANPPKTDVIPTRDSTGPQIIEQFGAMLDVLSALNSDTSNPLNNTVAKKIAECITTVHEPDADGRTELTNMLDTQAHSGFAGIQIKRIDNNSVTRYSNGTFVATDYLGATYDAKVVEGYEIDSLGKTLVQQAFEWDATAALPGYRLVVSVPGDAPSKYGDVPPIIVDASRADAPWHL